MLPDTRPGAPARIRSWTPGVAAAAQPVSKIGVVSGYLMNSAAFVVTSSSAAGATPSTSVARVPIVNAAEVSAPGMDTVGVFSPGSDSHIRTTTRRYGNARIALDTTPAITSQVWPAPIPAANTPNLAVKPLVSGIPANASRMNVNTAANSGERRPRPAQRDRWVASPSASRTRVTTANAASTVKPYATR